MELFRRLICLPGANETSQQSISILLLLGLLRSLRTLPLLITLAFSLSCLVSLWHYTRRWIRSSDARPAILESLGDDGARSWSVLELFRVPLGRSDTFGDKLRALMFTYGHRSLLACYSWHAMRA